MGALDDLSNLSINDKFKFKINPYNYQMYGIDVMLNCIKRYGFVINADDVGIGKTLQAIGVMMDFFNNGAKKVLIICKKSIKIQWLREIEKFTNLSNDVIINYTEDTASTRKDAYLKTVSAEKAILITNYHTFLNDKNLLSSIKFDLAIIDEAHVVKNRDGKINNAIADVVKGLPVVFLTGTPIMSKPTDLYGIVSISGTDYFGTRKEFDEKFVVYSTSGKYGTYPIEFINQTELRNLISQILIRRLVKDVSIEMPQIVESEIDVNLTPEECKYISDINSTRISLTNEVSRLRNKIELTEKEKTELTKYENILKSIHIYEQGVCNDARVYADKVPWILTMAFNKAGVPKERSLKMEALISLVSDLIECNHKVVIFSQYATFVKMMRDELVKEIGNHVVIYTGDMSTQEKQKSYDDFVSNGDIKIIIGTDAMAEGLNMQVAQYLINFDLPENSAIYTQRIGRIRRVGSNAESVFVYNLLARDLDGCVLAEESGMGSEYLTIDDKRYDKIQETAKLSSNLLGDTDKVIDTIGGYNKAGIKDDYEFISYKRAENDVEADAGSIQYDYTIQQSMNMKIEKPVWTIKFTQNIPHDDFKKINEIMRKYGGKYSSYSHGYVFYKDVTDIMKKLRGN